MSMHQAAVAAENLEVTPELIVTEIVSSRDAFVTWTIDAHENGLVLRRTPADLSPSRFMWLEFDLPSGHGIRALAEVIEQGDDTTSIQFKHLWPRDRLAYNQYLATLQLG